MDSEEARCRSIMARAMEVARRERAPAADWQPLEKDPSQLDDFRRLTLIGSPGDAVFDHMDRTRSRIVTYPKSACTRDRAVSTDGTNGMCCVPKREGRVDESKVDTQICRCTGPQRCGRYDGG